MKQYKSHGDSPFVGHGDCVGHGDGPFVSVPLFVLLTVGNQGDRYKRTVPLFPIGPSLCFPLFPLFLPLFLRRSLLRRCDTEPRLYGGKAVRSPSR